MLSKAHQADIGNCGADPLLRAMARDVYEEGAVILPCVKVQSDYRDIEDVIRMCRMRIRVPEQWWGDYLALLGCGPGRRARGQAAGRRRSAGTGSTRYVVGWLDYSEQRMAEAIRGCPTGELTRARRARPVRAAPDGVPLTISVEIGDDEIEVDLRDNPDCQPCG